MPTRYITLSAGTSNIMTTPVTTMQIFFEIKTFEKAIKLHLKGHMMRNAWFGPLTLLMTLRDNNVKSDDKFMALTSDSMLLLVSEAVFIGTDISFRISYKSSLMNQRFLKNPWYLHLLAYAKIRFSRDATCI